MKKVLLSVVLAIIAIVVLREAPFAPNFERPAVLSEPRHGQAIRRVEFVPLFDTDQPLSALAVSGSYTVVEVFLDSCPICKKLERDFPAFTEKRADVVIQRVHMPEDGLKLAATGGNKQELEKQVAEFKRRIGSYDMCGTPHIEIYGPTRQLIARDACRQRPGTRYLRAWIAAET